jgi:hypothetical protein
MGFNEVAYSCTGCVSSGRPYALCFHCKCEHDKRIPILTHRETHELDLLPDIMLVDPTTASNGRLGEIWNCSTCLTGATIPFPIGSCHSAQSKSTSILATKADISQTTQYPKYASFVAPARNPSASMVPARGSPVRLAPFRTLIKRVDA